MAGYLNVRSCVAIAALAACGLARSAAVDAAGDFLPTYTGPQNGDLDVLAVDAIHYPALGRWELRATLAAPVGTTPGAFYVWGVNRGAGTAGFNGSLGLSGVLFDAVALIRPGGASTIAGAPIPAAGISALGTELVVTFADSLLPSTGIFDEDEYTWNLWPRSATFTPGPAPVLNAAAISDFAPDNSNIATRSLPAPASGALVLAALAALALARRRRA